MAGGKTKEVVDQIYQQNQGLGSRRNVRRHPNDWSAAEDAALIDGVEKYRRFGFSLKATMELIKKDVEYHDVLATRTTNVVRTRFGSLVEAQTTVALVSNNEVVDGLLAGPAVEGHADTLALSQLCESFIDLASTRLARNYVRR